MPYSAEVVAAGLNRFGVLVRPDSDDLQVLIDRLNAVIRGETFESADFTAGTQLIRDGLRGIRESAAAGSYSFGGPSLADVAAGLILHAGVTELWEELTDFLCDIRVQRDDRSAAFTRLARERPDLPEGVRSTFTHHIDALLGPSETFVSAPVDPYPQALRFLAVEGLLEEGRLLNEISKLAAAPGLLARVEAAATVAAVAAVSDANWLASWALEFSHDESVDVRAFAAQALAAIGASQSTLAPVANGRVAALLDADGLLVPTRVLQAVTEVPRSTELSVRLREIAQNHPSRMIREMAGRLTA
jgi:hypothetical protein